MVLGEGLFSKWCERGFGWRYCIFSRWLLQIFFIFTSIWGRFPICRAYFSDGWFNHQPVFFAYILRFGKKCIFFELRPNWESIRGRIFKKNQFYHIRLAIIAWFFCTSQYWLKLIFEFWPPSKNLRSTLFLIQGHNHLPFWPYLHFFHTNVLDDVCFFNGTNFGPTGVTTTLHQSDRASWDFWCDGKCWQVFFGFPSLKLTFLPLKMGPPWKMRFLLDTNIFWGYVSFREGIFFVDWNSVKFLFRKMGDTLPPIIIASVKMGVTSRLVDFPKISPFSTFVIVFSRKGVFHFNVPHFCVFCFVLAILTSTYEIMDPMIPTEVDGHFIVFFGDEISINICSNRKKRGMKERNTLRE